MQTLFIPIVSDSAADGVGTNLVPATTSKQLGNASYPWETLFLSSAAGEGIATDLVPILSGNKDLGNSSYHWGDIYGTNVALKATRPYVELRDDAADVDNKVWIWRHWTGNKWVLELADDAKSGFSPRVWFERTLNVLDRITLECNLEANSTSYDLGTASKKWGNLYVNNTVYTDKLSLSTTAGEGAVTDIYPSDGTKDLGASARRWAEVWGDYADFTTVNTTILKDISDSSITVQSHLVPQSAAYDLGSSLTSWGEAHVVALYLGSSGIFGHTYPGSDGLYDFGSATKRWNTGYFENSLRVHRDTTNVLLQLGRGTTDDATKWEFSAGAGFGLYSRDQNWALGNSVFTVSRTGTTVDEMVMYCDFRPSSSGAYDLGGTTYYWNGIYGELLHIRQDYPTIRFQDDGTTTSYFAMYSSGHLIELKSETSSWASPTSLLVFKMSSDSIIDYALINGPVINFPNITKVTSWTKSNSKSIDVTANQAQRGWVKFHIDGVSGVSGQTILVPYWHDVDVS